MSFSRKLWCWLQGFFGVEHWERIRVEPETVRDICQLARSAAPKEMILFLTGGVHTEGEERVLVIDGLYVKSYYANEHSTSFTTHDLPLLGNVYGTVHSHPGWSNRPSGADLQLFNQYGSFHLIIARPYVRRSIAAYDKYGNRIAVEL